MENSTLVALSGQLALKRKLDVIANNVANINTDGFKRLSVDFEAAGMPRAEVVLFPRRDRDPAFVREQTTVSDFSVGTVDVTGNDLDVALSDANSFFAVGTPAGERYTRAGAFQIDGSGRLVTADGRPVLGEGGEIVFTAEESNIHIAADGTISTSAGPKDRLKLARFADTSVLERQGDNLYSATVPPAPPESPGVRQGAIERSNISGVQELTALIDVQRAYERLTTLMRQQNDLRSKAIDRLGSLSA